MEIDALLADYAVVTEGKLYLSGGGITGAMTAPFPPHVISLYMGVVLSVPYTATNQEHTVSVRLLGQDGESARAWIPGAPDEQPPLESSLSLNVGRPPQLVAGAAQSVPLAFGFTNLPLEQPGQYHFSVMVDGTELKRLPLDVQKAPQQSLISQFPV
jgi:hypothetical protein